MESDKPMVLRAKAPEAAQRDAGRGELPLKRLLRFVLHKSLMTLALFCGYSSASMGIAVIAAPPPSHAKIAIIALKAELGDAASQVWLGRLYESGFGVKQSYARAAHWYLRAAAKGSNFAENKLILLYELGQGVLPDHQAAVEWFRKAVTGDENAVWPGGIPHLSAAQELVPLYHSRHDFKKAAEWLAICADGGNGSCQHDLGSAYLTGSDLVPQDLQKAMIWLVKTTEHTGNAEETSQPRAEFQIGQMYANGLGVAQDYERAMQWYLRTSNYADNQFAIAELYANGRGVSRNYPLAAEWYAKVAHGGRADAKGALADLYASGQGVPQSDRDAMFWYLRAANSWDGARVQPAACGKLFAIFEKGKGVPADAQSAVAWYRVRAEQGDFFAQSALILSYACGYRVGQNLLVAFGLDTLMQRHESTKGGVVHEMVSEPPADRVWAGYLASKLPDSYDFLAALALFLNNPPQYDSYIDE
jgi:TPR repeat protein